MTDKELFTIWCAWHEFKSIQARTGAPFGICEDYWNDTVRGLEEMLPETYRKPWPPQWAAATQNSQEGNDG